MSLYTAKVSDLRNQTSAVFEKRIAPGAVLFRLLINDQYIEYAPPSSFCIWGLSSAPRPSCRSRRGPAETKAEIFSLRKSIFATPQNLRGASLYNNKRAAVAFYFM